MNDQITFHESGAVSITGRDAMTYYQAVQLHASMSLFVRTGLRPTRGVGGRAMLAMAGAITGKPYKARQYAAALTDLRVWISTMRAALPVTVEGVAQP